MTLSCSCDYEYDPEYGDKHYWFNNGDLDFEPLKTSKRKRCVSCNALIDIGSLCIRYLMYRYPYSEIEANILGCDPELCEEPPIRMADRYHCEKCGEIFLNLTSIGYECLSPSENMESALKEYHEISGFVKQAI